MILRVKFHGDYHGHCLVFSTIKFHDTYHGVTFIEIVIGELKLLPTRLE